MTLSANCSSIEPSSYRTREILSYGFFYMRNAFRKLKKNCFPFFHRQNIISSFWKQGLYVTFFVILNINLKYSRLSYKCDISYIKLYFEINIEYFNLTPKWRIRGAFVSELREGGGWNEMKMWVRGPKFRNLSPSWQHKYLPRVFLSQWPWCLHTWVSRIVVSPHGALQEERHRTRIDSSVPPVRAASSSKTNVAEHFNCVCSGRSE